MIKYGIVEEKKEEVPSQEALPNEDSKQVGPSTTQKTSQNSNNGDSE